MKKRVSVAVCIALLVLLAIAAVIAVPMSREYLYPREYSEYVTRYCDAYSVPDCHVPQTIETASEEYFYLFSPSAPFRCSTASYTQ